ncbi:tripartite tricarboxylate transporter TctB family protein [Microbacterium proteolyticum]|uniref:tripartite tricarboxylate transporter TctB family protein n=1 Tax=Microbacterium proteolyticum TaxID=1572644 RepID=UPI001FAC7C04|nr:tripartite tricarboxylate transporter TctB family protein [Microbacterium proteolyticum]MCI9857655.1 tripartite tricarboxylate transporter TctB family protein [Microbacterium proteolyticum]
MTTTETPGADTVRPRWGAERIGNAIFASVVFSLGVFALVGAFAIRVPAGQAIGPQVFPFAVAVILLGSGAALVISALRGQVAPREEGEDIDPDAKTDWWTILKLVALLVAVLLLLELLGWWMVAALLFGGVAWTLGAKRPWVAFLVGLVIGIGTQLLFGEGLGLFLPRGAAFDWWYGPGPLFG